MIIDNQNLLLINESLTLSQLESGTFTVSKDGDDTDYSQYLGFACGTTVIDSEYASEHSFPSEYIGLNMATVVVSNEMPQGDYTVNYEYDGTLTMMPFEVVVLFDLYYGIDGDLYLVSTFPVQEGDENVTVDNIPYTLGTDYDVYGCTAITDGVYSSLVETVPSLPRTSIGCYYMDIEFSNELPGGRHTAVVGTDYDSATLTFDIADTTDYLRFIAQDQTSLITLNHFGNNRTSTMPQLSVSKDRLNWAPWLGDTVELLAGETLYIRGTNRQISYSTEHFSQFSITGRVNLAGNVMSLLSPWADGNKLYEYCLFNMFMDCTGLVSAGNAYLPDVLMGEHCCDHMFAQSKITTPMDLRPTELSNGCYFAMYSHCLDLVSGGVLPASEMVEDCYTTMFEGCGSLADVTVNIMIWNQNWSFEWLRDTAPVGTVTCPMGR